MDDTADDVPDCDPMDTTDESTLFEQSCFVCQETILTEPKCCHNPREMLEDIAKLLQISPTIYETVDLSCMSEIFLCSTCEETVSSAVELKETVMRLQDHLQKMKQMIKGHFGRDKNTSGLNLKGNHKKELQRIRRTYTQCLGSCVVRLDAKDFVEVESVHEQGELPNSVNLQHPPEEIKIEINPNVFESDSDTDKSCSETPCKNERQGKFIFSEAEVQLDLDQMDSGATLSSITLLTSTEPPDTSTSKMKASKSTINGYVECGKVLVRTTSLKLTPHGGKKSIDEAKSHHSNRIDTTQGDRSENQSKQVSCDLCGQFLGKLELLKRHWNWHVRLTKCDICGEVLESPCALNKHRIEQGHAVVNPVDPNRSESDAITILDKPRTDVCGAPEDKMKVPCIPDDKTSLSEAKKPELNESKFVAPKNYSKFPSRNRACLRRTKKFPKRPLDRYARKMYACEHCPSNFSQLSRLITHTNAKHLGIIKCYCGICRQRIPQDQFRGHQKDEHGITNVVVVRNSDGIITSFDCNACITTYSKTEFLNSANELQIVCQLENCSCGTIFSQFEEFLNHHKKVCTLLYWFNRPNTGTGNSKKGNFFCKFCGKVFGRLVSLNDHLLVHHQFENKSGSPIKEGSESDDSSIENCVDLEQFKQTELVQEHDFQSNDKRPVKLDGRKCPCCYKVISVYVNFERHVELHNGETDFPCKECPARFKSVPQLLTHINRRHKPDYHCDTCQKSFTFKEFLSHKREVHSFAPSLPKKFHCIICGRGYSTRSRMDIHMKTHTEHVSESIRATVDNDKNLISFECNTCKKIFFKDSFLNTENELKITCELEHCHCTSNYNDFKVFMNHHKNVCNNNCDLNDVDPLKLEPGITFTDN